MCWFLSPVSSVLVWVLFVWIFNGCLNIIYQVCLPIFSTHIHSGFFPSWYLSLAFQCVRMLQWSRRAHSPSFLESVRPLLPSVPISWFGFEVHPELVNHLFVFQLFIYLFVYQLLKELGDYLNQPVKILDIRPTSKKIKLIGMRSYVA